MESDPSVTSLDINVWYTRTMKLMIILSVLMMAVVVDAFVGSIRVRVRLGKKRSINMMDAETEDGATLGERHVNLTQQQKEELVQDLEKKIKDVVMEEKIKYGI